MKTSAARSPSVVTRSTVTLFLFGWAAAVLVGGATLAARHQVGLPVPAEDKIGDRLASLRQPGADFTLVHVLYAKCACSRRVFDHLLDPKRPPIDEVVLLAGASEPFEARAAAAGLRVVRTEPEQLKERWGVEAAPLLVVFGPDNAVRYAGGYTARKQGPVIEDTSILSLAEAGVDSAPLPLFGCAVSKRLQALLDPMGLAALGVDR